jgi:hypothetical protein
MRCMLVSIVLDVSTDLPVKRFKASMTEMAVISSKILMRTQQMTERPVGSKNTKKRKSSSRRRRLFPEWRPTPFFAGSWPWQRPLARLRADFVRISTAVFRFKNATKKKNVSKTKKLHQNDPSLGSSENSPFSLCVLTVVCSIFKTFTTLSLSLSLSLSYSLSLTLTLSLSSTKKMQTK